MISFVTPYLCNSQWLELHLSSIRQFHPDAEIIISAPDYSAEAIVEKYKVRYFANNTDYYQAVEFLFETASNDIILLSDCDTVLFNNVDYLTDKLNDFDLIGIEERIKFPDRNLWFRYAPGYTDMTFFMFSRSNAKAKNPNWPKYPKYALYPKRQNTELHYGLCKKLSRHYYLRPYATKKYGLGNLLKDGNKNILWHQWFGSWEKRGTIISQKSMKERPDKPYKSMGELITAEQRFFKDYPNPDLANLKPLF